MFTFTPIQDAFRFYGTGTWTTPPTALAAQDTNVTPTVSADYNFHLRFRLEESGGAAGLSTDDWQLQVSRNSGAYQNVTTTSSIIKGYNDAANTHPDASFAAGVLTGGTGSYQASWYTEAGIRTGSIINASSYVELVYSLTIVAADVANNDTLDFRVLYNSATFTYNVTPRITVTATSNQTLTPSLFTNTQTFHSPTVFYDQALTPSLFTNTQTFHAPSVGQTQPLTPSLFTNTQTFHAPRIAAGLGPTLFTNTQSFFAPTVATSYSLTPSLFTNSQSFPAAVVTAGGPTQDLTPALFTNTNTFHAATVSTSYSITPALFSNSQSFFAPSVASAYTLTPALFTNNQSFPASTVSASYALTPGLFTNSQTFHDATIANVIPAEQLYPDLFTNSQVFFPMAVWADVAGGSGPWTPGSPGSGSWTPIPPMTDNWS